MISTASDTERKSIKQNGLLMGLISVFVLTWGSTLVGTSDIVNWLMENVLVIIFLLTLSWTYNRFKFSNLTYLFICVYLMLHVYGAKYTYAENPFGYWLQDQFHTSRNHYDRIVHFSFGFLLAYPMRDLFKNYFEFPVWVCWVLPVEITLSFSGAYELIEWLVADVVFPEQGTAYLGTQGDEWDAQKDMALAFSGSVLIMIFAGTAKKLLKR